MLVYSSAFKNGQAIPFDYTGDSGNGSVNPPLEISDVPSLAQSLAIICSDPDAPSGPYIHWVIWNIPPSTAEISAGTAPTGIAGRNSGGYNGYRGPNPPAGSVHHYHFTVYALNEMIPDNILTSYSNAADLEQVIAGHKLDQAEIIGTYSKDQ